MMIRKSKKSNIYIIFDRNDYNSKLQNILDNSTKF